MNILEKLLKAVKSPNYTYSNEEYQEDLKKENYPDIQKDYYDGVNKWISGMGFRNVPADVIGRFINTLKTQTQRETYSHPTDNKTVEKLMENYYRNKPYTIEVDEPKKYIDKRWNLNFETRMREELTEEHYKCKCRMVYEDGAYYETNYDSKGRSIWPPFCRVEQNPKGYFDNLYPEEIYENLFKTVEEVLVQRGFPIEDCKPTKSFA